MIGARDLAFPRANAFSYYTYLASGVSCIRVFGDGRLRYPPGLGVEGLNYPSSRRTPSAALYDRSTRNELNHGPAKMNLIVGLQSGSTLAAMDRLAKAVTHDP